MSTPEGRNRIDLNNLFQSTQQRMVAELTGIRGAVDHGGTLGDETELAWLDFLARVLPNRYRVANGFVVDADGRRSDQMDVIVFDRQYSPPLFMGGNVQYVPAEAVYAVFEVKQRVDSRNLRLACDKAASVRSLRRTSAAIPSADGTLAPKPPHRYPCRNPGVVQLVLRRLWKSAGRYDGAWPRRATARSGMRAQRLLLLGKVQGRRGRNHRIKPRFIVPRQLYVPVAGCASIYWDRAGD